VKRFPSISFLVPVTATLLLATSCEKNITVDLPQAESQIVVEGYVITGEKPRVNITRSAPYFSPIDSSSLASYLVHFALVTVSDGTTTDTLDEQYDPSFPNPIVYKARTMIGENGKDYFLKVVVDGKTLTAVTQVPYPVPLDSVWFKVDGNKDSLGYAWAHLTDPDTLGNAYRWFAKRMGKDDDYIPPQGSVFDDKFINGKSFDFGYNRGALPNSDAIDDNNDERGHFKRGDTIAVKFCTIDRAHFLFWRSVETQTSNNGNPFGSPAPIEGNIEGGLGIWGGYGLSYDTIYAQ
jgi:hypothetical protein